LVTSQDTSHTSEESEEIMRRTFLRRAAILMATLTVLATAGVVTAAPAYALCWHDSCNWLDPQSSGCSAGAQTIDDFVFEAQGYAYVELRYSPACGAAWARYSVGAEGEIGSTKYLRLQVWPSSSGGSMITYTNKTLPPSTAYGQVFWTPMYSFTYWVQACVKNSSLVGPCTARH
jgi:hypothetical protein